MRNRTVSLIRCAKKIYYDKINQDLSDPKISSKKWWNICKCLRGNIDTNSIPAIVENDVTVIDPVKKAEIFNEYFVGQSKLPSHVHTPPLLQPYQTVCSLSNILTTNEEVLELMKNVDTSKACGHDGIGNKIIQFCSYGFSPGLTSFINLSLRLGQYPSQWKLANVIPIYKKDNRHCKNNYRPVSLLPCLSKLCEKIVFIRLYDFLTDIGYLYKFQSGFRPGDSTVNQLTYLVHQIYSALDSGKEVRLAFLDISKAFDKVWHDGLICKLESLGVCNPLLNWLRSYLGNRKQRVVLEGSTSGWRSIDSGVPQGSVLFLIYINDLTDNLSTPLFIYADDITLLEIVDEPLLSARRLNEDLEKISTWSSRWLVTMNPSKCRSMVISWKKIKPYHPPLVFESYKILQVESHCHLGLTFHSAMSWKTHIFGIYEKANKRLSVLKSLMFKINRSTLISLYKSLIRPIMEYADVIWDNCSEGETQLLESVQYESARVITGAIKGTSARLLRNELALEELSTRRQLHKLALFYKIANMLTPMYLTELLPCMQREISQLSLRSDGNFSLLRCRTVRYHESFVPSTIKLWNDLSLDIRNSQSILVFKVKLRSHFSSSDYNKLFNYSVTRRLSVLHTRLRLGHCALNDYLFKINCKTSPLCSCGINNESVMHYLVYCPLFAAQRASLLASAVQTNRRVVLAGCAVTTSKKLKFC